ncbi:phosphatase PAP2 family protein [Sporolactobacillus sp. Y61]|jgi:undecaprenyl-diphosphatase|uniref:Phosphatase PAP2 family protein n=1 Tax=Sporolactobacillus sp. Y61 TaxID=3160863 RepID=A0AAU8IDF5_9BACL|nr:phosphatase PAP2 family protein [Sporolactobacillus sp. THM19-2]RYL93299.1 phosphatase PAP2 family protein [Sporolactobacillus sp. THM19-2]
MAAKSIDNLYEVECQIFKRINCYFEHRGLYIYFRLVTSVGGAVTEILAVLLILFFAEGTLHRTAVACAISLTGSHIIVQVLKRLFPRNRPYLALAGAKVMKNPLTDHSFPSGHATAVFSVIIPLILYQPMLVFLLLPLALSVATSRIFLGLHYPSDVLAGISLGTLTGLITYFQMMS